MKPLVTANNDGNAVAKFLKEDCDFDVSIHERDCSILTVEGHFDSVMTRCRENSKKQKKTAVFFYYSGHGLLIDGMTVACHISGKEFSFESSVRDIAKLSNTLVICMLDCCRQIPPITTKTGVQKVVEKTAGQCFILYAAGPGRSAITRIEADGLSEVTKEFLFQMRKASETFPTCINLWAKYHNTVEIISKMCWDFCLKRGTITPVATTLPNKPFDQWSTQSVAEWMSTLNLSSEFNAQKVVDKKIDGSGVLVIRDSDAWLYFGFTVDIDVLKIKEALKKLLDGK